MTKNNMPANLRSQGHKKRVHWVHWIRLNIPSMCMREQTSVCWLIEYGFTTYQQYFLLTFLKEKLASTLKVFDLVTLSIFEIGHYRGHLFFTNLSCLKYSLQKYIWIPKLLSEVTIVRPILWISIISRNETITNSDN